MRINCVLEALLSPLVLVQSRQLSVTSSIKIGSEHESRSSNIVVHMLESRQKPFYVCTTNNYFYQECTLAKRGICMVVASEVATKMILMGHPVSSCLSQQLDHVSSFSRLPYRLIILLSSPFLTCHNTIYCPFQSPLYFQKTSLIVPFLDSSVLKVTFKLCNNTI